MASLLSKFRIDYSALKVISGISKPAQKQTVNFFESLIQEFMQADNSKTEFNNPEGREKIMYYSLKKIRNF